MSAELVTTAFLNGLFMSLVLIVAIGAQNAYVLRQGLRREHVSAVVLFCAVSDAVLISAGVAGMAQALQGRPMLATALAGFGALFLAGYGLRALWRSRAAGALRTVTQGSSLSRTAVLAQAAGFTLLNPHVYLDTVFLLGSVANTHGADRWWFAAGAAAASVLWFFSLALGARHLGRRLATPRSWRIVDGVIAVVMIALAVSLVWPR